ncbi:MAG: restriction endonuclease subunit S [Chthoniobacterales bacterium]|nr:restriction endonuclease subunit S [Chthoniobacterales bacterium]
MKPVYRKTEAGVIPEDWEISRLGDFSLTSSGTTPARALKDRYYKNGKIGWVKTLDLRNTELLATSECVTELAFKETSLTIYPVGTVLVAMYGGFQQIGRTGLLRIPAAVNQAITAIQPKGDKLHSEYLLATLNYRVGYWKNVASSSRKDPNISSQDIRNFPIAYPKPPEQRAIAKALRDVGALLSSLDRLISKKRDLKTAAMQQLLTGKTRLPGFSGEWDQVTLGSLFSFKNGLNKAKEFFGYGTPIVNYMDVFRCSKIRTAQLTGRVMLTTQEIQNFDVKRGDVFFTRTSETPEEIGIASVMIDEPRLTVFSGFLLRGRRKNDRLCDVFKAYCFTSELVRKQIISKASYTTRALTSGTILSAVILPIPPLPEQIAIAEVLSEMDAELAALEKRRDKTRDLKQGMMQELLTGRIRLI